MTNLHGENVVASKRYRNIRVLSLSNRCDDTYWIKMRVLKINDMPIIFMTIVYTIDKILFMHKIMNPMDIFQKQSSILQLVINCRINNVALNTLY